MPLEFPTKSTIKTLTGESPTYTDLTRQLNDWQRESKVVALKQGEFLFIGRDKPFSDLWFELKVPSTATVDMVVEYWDGTAWVAAPVTTEDTAGWTRSGWLRWNKNAMTKDGSETLGSLNWAAYEVDGVKKFWLRLSFSDDLSATTEVMAIGIVFSDDLQLQRVVPDIMTFLPKATDNSVAWSSWILTHVTARDIMTQRLRSSATVKIDMSTGYPLDMDEWDFHRIDQVREAARWLALKLIFQNLATQKDDTYSQKANDYDEAYESCWKTGLLSLDMLNNGQENPGERTMSHNSAELSRW